jgi:hypothetical protein
MGGRPGQFPQAYELANAMFRVEALGDLNDISTLAKPHKLRLGYWVLRTSSIPGTPS